MVFPVSEHESDVVVWPFCLNMELPSLNRSTLSHVCRFLNFTKYNLKRNMGYLSGGGHGNPLQYYCLENLHEQRSLVSYSPWGRKELDTTEWLSTWVIYMSTSGKFWSEECFLRGQSLPFKTLLLIRVIKREKTWKDLSMQSVAVKKKKKKKKIQNLECEIRNGI